MTETPGTGPVWREPLVTGMPEPDWAALAERHEQQARRRKQIRAVAAGVVATTAIGGIIATVIQVSGSGHKSAHTAATSVGGDRSGSVSGVAPGEGASPSADPAASAGASAGTGASAFPSAPPSGSATARSAAPAAGSSPGSPPPPVGAGGPQGPPTPSPATGNPYSAGQVCGSGYKVIDSHDLGDARVYLLFNGATGDNCVATLANHPSGAVPMNATLTVRGGGSASDPGTVTDYAGPVTEHAPKACVEWGGSYRGATWTSGWSHCG